MSKNKYYSFEAEASIIGALLINNDIFDEVDSFLKPEYFYGYENQEIYKLIQTIISKGRKAEVISVTHLASLDDDLKEKITIESLTEIISSAPNFDSVKDHAEIVKDNYIRRELIELLNNLSNNLNTFDNAVEAITSIETDIFRLSENYFVGNNIKTFEEAIELAFEAATNAKNRDGTSGVSTNFRDIDKYLGGLQKSDLIIIAGRPAMGKTALATNIAYNVADSNNNSAVLLFSLEMSAEQVASRILSHETNTPNDSLRKGTFGKEQIPVLLQAVSTLKTKPLFIDDSPLLTVSELRSKARKIKRTNNLQLIVVDYLQLMRSNKKTENRIIELSEITRGLKAVAKELNIPIIALSQLSRAVESREDKKPILSDLRESGTIEQDADIVAFIYREEYYLRMSEPAVSPNEDPKNNESWVKWCNKLQKVANLATLIFAKNRHGPTKNIQLRFNALVTKFEDLDNIHNN